MGLITKRIKRAARELLGLEQWPEQEDSLPTCFEEQLYAALVQDGDLCFDIGAHHGGVGLFLSHFIGDYGTVIAFEPVWPVYQRMCKTIRAKSLPQATIVPVPLGVSDRENDAEVHIPNGDFGMASMAEKDNWVSAHQGAKVDTYRVKFTTIDSFLAISQLRAPHFLKIDVEGAELLVLKGATKFFAEGNRPLMLMEVFAPWEKAFGYQPNKLFALLGELNYRIVFVCPTGLVEHEPTEDEPFPAEYELGYNIIAYQPESHQDRMGRIRHFYASQNPKLLPMDAPPCPNVIT